MMRRPRSSNDEGAVLILALVFLVAVALVLLALVSLAGTNLVATSKLQAQRNLEYAADSLVDGAIQTVRSEAPNPLPNPACPNFPSNASLQPNGENLIVECTMGIPAGFYGRIVEFDACAAPAASFATCQSGAIVRAEVVFNDVSKSCSSGATPGCYGGTPGFWGTSVTIESWTVETAND
jgi:hypothetical protein